MKILKKYWSLNPIEIRERIRIFTVRAGSLHLLSMLCLFFAKHYTVHLILSVPAVGFLMLSTNF
jgi:hypothetical protein